MCIAHYSQELAEMVGILVGETDSQGHIASHDGTVEGTDKGRQGADTRGRRLRKASCMS